MNRKIKKAKSLEPQLCKCGHMPKGYQSRSSGTDWTRMVQCNHKGCSMWGGCFSLEDWNALDFKVEKIVAPISKII